MTGLRGPKSRFTGRDFAGTVEAVGKDVTDLRPGDEVFGGKKGGGAFAEYVGVPTDVARKPAGLTFEEAAAVPVAALTALQGLRDHGQVRLTAADDDGERAEPGRPRTLEQRERGLGVVGDERRCLLA